MRRHVSPRLSEKNACPIAPIIMFGVICEKSGLNINSRPFLASGNNRELTQKTSSKMNRIGIRKFEIRSIPFCMPFRKIRKLIPRNRIVHRTERQGELARAPNISEYS